MKIHAPRFVSLFVAFVVLFSCLSQAAALTFDGTSSPSNPGSTSAAGSYGIVGNTDSTRAVGYRFTVVSKSGGTAAGPFDLFRSATCTTDGWAYDAFEKFAPKYSKVALKNGYTSLSFSTSNTSTNRKRDTDIGLSLPEHTTGMNVWCSENNIKKVLSEGLGNWDVDALVALGYAVLIEPIYPLKIANAYYSLTVTEIAVYGASKYGASAGTSSAGGDGSWGWISGYTNRDFPNSLYLNKSYFGLGAASELSSRATFANIISKGYGAAVVYGENLSNFSVQYDANGGTGAPASQVKVQGKSLTLSSTLPTRTGYKFTGWSTAKDGSGTKYAAGGTYSADQDVTLYAQWSPNRLTVNYYSNYATEAFNDALNAVDGTKNVLVRTYDQYYYNKAYPTGLHNYKEANAGTYLGRTGFTASGYWGTTTTGGTLVHQDTAFTSGEAMAQAFGRTLVDGDVTIDVYAQWLQNYTVKYDANGGTGAPDSQTKVHGVDLTLSDVEPTKEGSNFVGWNTEPDGSGASFSSEDVYTENKDTTLYARWSDKHYMLMYMPTESGVTNMPDPNTQYKFHDIDLTLSATVPLREGYVFTGWNTERDGSGGAYPAGGVFTANATTFLYTMWKPATYTITYECDNDGVLNMPQPGTKQHSVDYSISAQQPFLTGHTFSGWNTQADGHGTAYASGDVYSTNADLVLFAQFTPETYPVIYDANGGTGAPEPQTKVYGVGLRLSSVQPVREGYTFVGWTTNQDGSGASYEAGKSYIYNTNRALTLYAQWEPIVYTVAYDANGGTGAPAPQLKLYNIVLDLREETPSREGYVFAGWNTDQNGLGASYEPGSPYLANADVTMFAQWARKTYTVMYDANGGTDAPEEQLFEHGSSVTLRSGTPSRDGHAFTGWNTDRDGNGDKYAPSDTYAKNANLVLYAQWDSNAPDDPPIITAVDRWFTLDEAQNSVITLQELMRTANAVDSHVGDETDFANGEGEFTIIDYATEDFTRFTSSGSVTVTYRAVDKAENMAYQTVVVHIIDKDQAVTGVDSVTQFTRFISPKYFKTDDDTPVSEEDGGLNAASVWTTNADYNELLSSVFDNKQNEDTGEWTTVYQTWSFSNKEIAEVKEYIETHGFGNSKESNALINFYNRYFAE